MEREEPHFKQGAAHGPGQFGLGLHTPYGLFPCPLSPHPEALLSLLWTRWRDTGRVWPLASQVSCPSGLWGHQRVPLISESSVPASAQGTGLCGRVHFPFSEESFSVLSGNTRPIPPQSVREDPLAPEMLPWAWRKSFFYLTLKYLDEEGVLEHITKPTCKSAINAWEPTLTPIFYHQELFSDLTFMRNGPGMKPEILVPDLTQVAKAVYKNAPAEGARPPSFPAH